MKKIDVVVKDDGTMSIDLGGDLDRGCCGVEAFRLNEALLRLGVEVKIEGVLCRLSSVERMAAKAAGECTTGSTAEVKS